MRGGEEEGGGRGRAGEVGRKVQRLHRFRTCSMPCKIPGKHVVGVIFAAAILSHTFCFLCGVVLLINVNVSRHAWLIYK